MSDTPQSGAEWLARIKPRLREQRTQICLRPDLLDAWEEANSRLLDAQNEDIGTKRLATGGTSSVTKKIAREVEAIQDEIERTSLWVTFRALPKDEWVKLCEQNPPRRGNDLDQVVGYDRDGVTDAAVRACMIDPEFDDQSWADFVKVVNPSEWAELRESVQLVNRAVTSTPKSAWAERALSRRVVGSGSPANGE